VTTTGDCENPIGVMVWLIPPKQLSESSTLSAIVVKHLVRKYLDSVDQSKERPTFDNFKCFINPSTKLISLDSINRFEIYLKEFFTAYANNEKERVLWRSVNDRLKRYIADNQEKATFNGFKGSLSEEERTAISNYRLESFRLSSDQSELEIFRSIIDRVLEAWLIG
jgi:hypothetical protein